MITEERCPKDLNQIHEEDPFEVIYFGSPNKTVNFSFVEGYKLDYNRELFINKRTNQTVNSSLLYKFPLRHLGPEYDNFYMVALPCNDILCKTYDNEFQQCCHKENGILNKCMLKISKEIKGDFKGYQSGCRSAIVKLNGKYYRLKGCGNLDRGFTERQMGFPKGAIDLRGCQFHHTGFREIYMSDLINEKISSHGFEVANKPIGLWLYGNVESEEKRISDDRKRIDKFCSVYEIYSEKRLGCQLMPGLEVILLEYIIRFIEVKEMENDLEWGKNYKEIIAELFSEKRIIRKNQNIENNDIQNSLNSSSQLNEISNCSDSSSKNEIVEIEPTTTYIPIVELQLEEKETIESLFNKYNIYSENPEDILLVDIQKLLKEKSQHVLLNYFKCNGNNLFYELIDAYFEKKEIYNLFTEKVNSQSKQLIRNKLENIQKNLELNKFSIIEIISLVFSRVGWESGRLKRIMQDNNINWGTYEDQPYRLHCNAHTDNYTINKRGWNKNQNILSILDFDLAFFKDNFINISDESQKSKFGFPDNNLFDSYLNMERQHLEWEFAGLENVISFDFYNDLMQNKQFEFTSKALFSIMRDSSVKNFREGYLMKEFIMQESYLKLYDDVYDIIEIALFISHDFMDKPF
jgi:hypothetical protein